VRNIVSGEEETSTVVFFNKFIADVLQKCIADSLFESLKSIKNFKFRGSVSKAFMRMARLRSFFSLESLISYGINCNTLEIDYGADFQGICLVYTLYVHFIKFKGACNCEETRLKLFKTKKSLSFEATDS
jgi:hypothetical protein